MEGLLQRLLISSRSVNKHGYHRQFLFLIDQFLKFFSSEIPLPNKLKFVGSIYGRSSMAKGIQRRRILEIGQSETRIACGGHVC
jgi:hypothetical protein